jgi:septum formation protein
MKIILASASPRRREILTNLGLEFAVVPSTVEEKSTETEPEKIAMELSRQKAQDVAKTACDKDTLVIGCDTIVVKNDKILGKPKTESQAKEMLTLLSGNDHTVISGLTLVLGDKVLSKCEKTQVFFDKISEEEMENYIASGDPFDKAGSYGIQGIFSKHISKIDGCYFNVVGLPTNALAKLFKEATGSSL